jgi:hypothetical protein
MKPGGMNMRDANATSMMLAMSNRLFRWLSLERISHRVLFGTGILPAPRRHVSQCLTVGAAACNYGAGIRL